jgi:prolyl-tRNA synthetase
VHVVILPVLRGEDTRGRVFDYIGALAKELRGLRFGERRVEVEIDNRDTGGGGKQWRWVRSGVPIRLEIGARDVDAGVVTMGRRDRGPKEKTILPRGELVASLTGILGEMQATLYRRALAYRDEHTRTIDVRADLDDFFTPKGPSRGHPEIHGGFALSHWCGEAACEKAVKQALNVTIPCIPTDGFAGAPWEARVRERGSCVVCGGPSAQRVIFARTY